MSNWDRLSIEEVLNQVIDPLSGLGLFKSGQVKALVVGASKVGFMLEVASEHVRLYEPVRDQAEALLAGLEGITKAQVVLTAQIENPQERAKPKASLSDQAVEQNRPRALAATSRPDFVSKVVVVGSGKGGVGKSTLSLGLALGLRALGLRVGYLDADIYGPSAPLMLGISTPPEFGPDKLMIAKEAYGLKVNSVGFLMDAGQAMIWRGPMASQALTQLLRQTQWGTEAEPLDILIIDMPPGTGDVHLTLTQKTLIDGGVVVTTPQEMALIDARRLISLFEKTEVPVLGVIENMAYLSVAEGQEMDIFGRGGAKTLAEAQGLAFLGEVPLDTALRQGCDTGRPLSALEPEGDIAQRFKSLAQALWQKLGAS